MTARRGTLAREARRVTVRQVRVAPRRDAAGQFVPRGAPTFPPETVLARERAARLGRRYTPPPGTDLPESWPPPEPVTRGKRVDERGPHETHEYRVGRGVTVLPPTARRDWGALKTPCPHRLDSRCGRCGGR